MIGDELEALREAPLSALPPASTHEHGMADFEFQPVLVDVPALDAPHGGSTAVQQKYLISFEPRPALYSNANESLLVLRELSRLGDATVRCDCSAVPLLDTLDATGAYLRWTIELDTSHGEAAVREVFDFVDGDCDLDIRCETPVAASDAAIADLIRKVQADMAAEPAASTGLTGAQGLPAVACEPPKRDSDPHMARAALPALASAEPAKAEAEPVQATIRVDLDRVDRLINLVGELVINRAMLSQRVIEADLTGSSAVVIALDELEQLTREIQESVMAIRAQPVRPLFQRMSRIVREVADATGKSVRLKTDGESTEVDKTVIERLADPLTHMIRNAVDHGLESAEQRRAAGKPAEGVVRLSAAHRSGRILIEVTDDGAGINRPRVRETAVQKGLIPADAQLTDNEIDNLLFLPGFSTASTVSNISGRGVGMDVVKRSIQALGGRISITSRPGLGSTFSMSLPLTLAVLDGMVVSVNGQTLVVPLTAIVETLKPKATNVHALGAGASVMAIRDAFVPLIDVGRELGVNDEPTDPLHSVAVLVETQGGARHALLVDRIEDQRQVVIKSLEANYGHVDGIAAATILGNGRVALIVDVDALVARCRLDAVPVETRLVAAG